MTTIEDIRRTCGILSDEIEDDDVARTINEAEDVVGNYLNSSITPKTVIESIDSYTSNSALLYLSNLPILNLKEIKIDGTSVTPQYIKFYTGGKIYLTDDAEETEWEDDEPQANVVKYIFGLVEDATTETTTTTTVTSPTDSYSLDISDISGMKASKWVRIYGMDGYSEVTQIDSVGASSITVDLSYPHENGSIVVIQKTKRNIERLIQIISSLMLVARIVGASYDDIVGYGLEGFNVQKGEPYTQWRETYKQLEAERQRLVKYLRPMPVVR